MRRTLRVALIAVGVAIALVVALLLWGVSRLDDVVQAAIERYGSELTGTAVRVESVEIELRSGRGTLRGLSIDNPQGFQAKTALRLGELTVQIDPAALGTSPVTLEQIVVIAPEVSYELDAKGGSNIQAIVANVERRSGSSASATAEPQAKPELRLAVRTLRFENGRISASGGGRAAEIDAPELLLQDVGVPQGLAPSQFGAAVLKSYSRQILRAVSSEVLGDTLGGVVGRGAGDLREGSSKALRGVLGGGTSR